MKLIKLFEQYIQEEVEASAPVTPIGKKELIEVLINHIRRIEKNNDWAAMDVAQVIYNDCAFFMNKDGVFSDKTKYGDTVTQPAAQTAPVAIPRPGMEDAMDNSIAPIAPTLSAEADPQFEQFIAEGSYPTLADYLVGAPNIKAKLSPTATHMITGSYFDMFGTLRVDLKLIEIATSKIVATAAGEGQGTDVSIFLFKALGALSAKITDPKITISSGQFPLAPGVTIDGVKTSLDKTA